MSWNGKIVGLMMGILFRSPLLALLGLAVGHLFDSGWFRRFPLRTQNSPIQTVFFNSSFMIMGHLAKADGHVTANEIRATEHVMDSMHLSPAMKQEAIRLFNVGKQPHFNLDETLTALRAACGSRPSLLSIFIDFQTKIVFADGQSPSPAVREKLAYICNQLRTAAYTQREFTNPFDHHHPLTQAYQLLGVTPQTSAPDIKKAYRRLMSQNHPDKLIAKGLPPEMIKLATQKTQAIKQAYELILKETKNA